MKKAKYDAIELRPINTERLKPIKIENKERGGYIKIREDGWVV
jgi:Polo-like Kinase 4 Polo Box 1